MEPTSASLLLRLRKAPNAADWNRFVELYTPLLFQWASRAGLRHDEATDLVQDVMLMLLRKIPEFEYDSTLRFRSWLKTVLLNRWRDVLKQKSRTSAVSTIDIESVADDQDDPFWEREYRQQLVRRALEVMRTDFREATWKACWLCVVEGQTAAEAAEHLGLSENAVYIAQHRVLRRLRAELDGLWN